MQQTPTQKTPTTPQPYVVPVSAVPQTGQEVQALRVRLDDLREQLQDAATRRRAVADQLPRADAASRPGIEARMSELDSRIVQLEKDISATGRLITNAPPAALLTAGSAAPFQAGAARFAMNVVPIIAILSVFVFAPIALAISRLIWKRATVAPRPPVVDQATIQRLEQLQQSVDTIAIEVERISEGQRFMTRVLSEKDRTALPAGAAEPVRQAKKSAIPTER